MIPKAEVVPEITPPQLADRLPGPNPPLLIDVREPDEYLYARIAGARLKPLSQILVWAADLDPEAEIVLHCHIGERSLMAAQYLQGLGFKQVFNLQGGIDAWSALVDPRVPRY